MLDTAHGCAAYLAGAVLRAAASLGTLVCGWAGAAVELAGDLGSLVAQAARTRLGRPRAAARVEAQPGAPQRRGRRNSATATTAPAQAAPADTPPGGAPRPALRIQVLQQLLRNSHAPDTGDDGGGLVCPPGAGAPPLACPAALSSHAVREAQAPVPARYRTSEPGSPMPSALVADLPFGAVAVEAVAHATPPRVRHRLSNSGSGSSGFDPSPPTPGPSASCSSSAGALAPGGVPPLGSARSPLTRTASRLSARMQVMFREADGDLDPDLAALLLRPSSPGGPKRRSASGSGSPLPPAPPHLPPHLLLLEQQPLPACSFVGFFG